MTDDPSPATEPGQARPTGRAVLPERRVGGSRTAAQRAQPGRRKPRRPSWLVVAGYGVLAIVCVLLAAATFLVVAAPLDMLRDRLAQQIKARTGRTLVVSGQTSLSIFPSLALSLGAVSISAPADMGGPPTVVMRSLEAHVQVLSLLSSQIVVKRLVLNGPLLDLRIDAQGRRSWDLAQASSVHRFAQLVPREAATASDANTHVAPGANVQEPPPEARFAQLLGQLAVATNLSAIDGTVRYSDERVGARQEITALNVDLTVTDPVRPLLAKGSFAWRDEKVGVEVTLGSALSLIESGQAQLGVRALARPLEAAFEGTVRVAGGLAVAGNLSVKAASAAALWHWLGESPPPANDAAALALASTVSLAAGHLALSPFSATMGDSVLSGDLTVAAAAVRPYVSGQIRVSELNLGSVLMRSDAIVGVQPQSAPPGASVPADTIDGLLRRKGAQGVTPGQVRGFTKRAGGAAGWSDDIIDTTGFGFADADLAVSVERLFYKNVKTGQGRLALALRDRVARVTLEDIDLYDGHARGQLTLDGSGQIPAAAANVTLDGVATSPLLGDALGFDWLDGRAMMTLALTGRGVSERQIIETLNGKVDLATANGAITGIDIAKVLRGIEQARFAAIDRSPAERTPFSELAASFRIADGVAENQDLRLTSPSLTVTGGGTFQLAERRLDYTVRGKVVANSPRDGTIINLAGLEIPLRIAGPWEKPTFTPDLTGLVKDQNGAAQTLKQIGKNLQSQEVQDALRGLLGGGDGGQRVKPRELLEKLLKKE
jgi:AsmA protein